MTKHHSIYLSASLGAGYYLPLHSRVLEYLHDGYLVLYAVETEPRHVMESLDSIDSESTSFVRRKRLLIIDRRSLYSKREILSDPAKACELFHAALRRLQSGRRGPCVIFSMPLSLTREHIKEGLTEYESRLGSSFEDSVKLICCYNLTMCQRLSLRHIVRILNIHRYTVHSRDWKPSPWPQHRIIDMVTDGLDESLGPGSGRLVLKTLKSVYDIDEDMVADSPEIYEEKLRRLIGSSADRVIEATIARITAKMHFEGKERAALAEYRVA